MAAVVAATSRSARETDIIARYGGEEFTILLPHTSAPQGKRLAERIRKSTESFEFADAAGDGQFFITVSAGVATFPELLANADIPRTAVKKTFCHQVFIIGLKPALKCP